MRRTKIARIVTLALAMLMLFTTLISVGTSAAGAMTVNAPYLGKYEGDLKTSIEQYLNGDIVQKLPSSVKNTDKISIIIDMEMPAIMDAYEKSDKTMSMVEFASGSEAIKVMSQAKQEKDAIIKSLKDKGVKFTEGVSYNTIFSGFEIVIQACDFDKTCEAVGKGSTVIVGEVYKPAESQLVENQVNFYEGTGIFNSSDFKFEGESIQGEGMVIAVLDTGLDYTHTAFSDKNFTANRDNLGLTKKMVAALLAAKDTKAEFYMPGVTADDLFVSDKVPFAFDYADADSDVYSMHNNHGTHVSGVIAGKDDTITGVAPQAQIVSMKTFSDVEESARTSWILSALEDCVLLEVDVINMSLGTACGFSRESDKEAVNGNVYQKIRDAGISLVVAASNSYNSAYGSDKNGNLGLTSNPDTSTVGSPSTYEGAMSVASINGKKTPYILFNNSIIYFVEATNASSKEKDFFEELLKDRLPADSTEAVDLEYVVVPGAGRPADYYGMDVTGKIVLVRRGSTTFEEKAQAAQDAGAAAIIIYNNVSGDIKMNAGTITIPICSISQDDGELLAANKKGTIKISRSQTSGPFISDFSSWGPAPNLSIKPEITAHGGNILSAVTGGGYDRLSGTSMACPNMAGFIALLRQYVIKAYEMPDKTAEDKRAINALVSCLTMSTADIMYNTNGLPYAVRKQGAGLANLVKASMTSAYIQTYDRFNGSVMSTSKIELGDDREKTGVYTFKFAINNFGDSELAYKLSAIVMTEGVSETETVRGETTVTEEGYLLNGAKFEVVSVTNGTKSGNKVTVKAGEVAEVEAKITLSSKDKKYLDESFENGMYVEGFVTLDAVSGTEIDLSVPYLAFYGDWTKAPLFDTDYFETNKDELDDGISQDDKVMADAYPTRPIGGLYSDYVSYLGSYYFQQNPRDEVIAANRDFIALSYSDETVHSFRFVWAGLLRNAAKMVVTITNDATGEVIFQTEKHDIRKSYGDGGSIYPANIEVEFDTQDYDLPNNAQLSVKIEGYLDYGDGGKDTNLKNTFEFPITIDYQAPVVTDCEFRMEYDKDLKKNKLYADVYVYDNHYTMALNFGFVRESTAEELANDPDKIKYRMQGFESYLTPVYSKENGTTKVTYELTDYIDDIKKYDQRNKNTFVVTAYDYALNMATYEIGLPDDYVAFYFAEAENETTYLSVNQVYQLNPILYPNKDTNPNGTNNPWKELLTYQTDDATGEVIKIVNDKIVAVGRGTATVSAMDEEGKTAEFHVTVLGPEDKDNPEYKEYDKPVADVFSVNGYETLKAYYYLNNDERDIGMTGDVKLFADGFGLKMFPSESVKLQTNFTPYLDSAELQYESSNEGIVIIKDGVVTAVSEGYASVTVRVMLDGKGTFYSKTINVEVKNPWIRSGPSLSHCFGSPVEIVKEIDPKTGEEKEVVKVGGTMIVPSDLNLTEIGQYAFSNFDYVDKVEGVDEISEEDPNLTKVTYLGENTITKVVLPIGIEKIGPYAFAGMTALEEVVIPYTVEAIEYGAFFGCSNLKYITFMDESTPVDENGVPETSLKADLRNVQLINMGAFWGCDLNGALVLDNARAMGDYAFAGNKNLKSVKIPATLRSIGGYAFSGNRNLKSVTVYAESVKYGPYVFERCESLSDMKTVDKDGNTIATINASVIPEGAFLGCKALKNMTIGKDVNVIGPSAFAKSGIASFTVAAGNLTFKVQSSENIVTEDGHTLVLVSPVAKGDFVLNDANITTIGAGAFSENNKITSVTIPNVTKIEKYAFYKCSALESVTLGKLSEVGEYAFFETGIYAHPDFSENVKIGAYAFAFTNITNVVIPNGATVSEGAFCESEKLTSVNIGNDVTIGMGAFMFSHMQNVQVGDTIQVFFIDGRWEMSSYREYNKNHYYIDYKSPLSVLVIGNNVTIGDSAFRGASDLVEATFGENITIGKQAFYNANSLKTIRDHSGADVGFKNVIAVGELAFSGDEQYVYATADPFGADLSGNSKNPMDYVMVTGGKYVFYYYGAAFETLDLTNVNLVYGDPTVENTSRAAFAYCTKLKSVILNENLKQVPEYLFYGCSKLESINLDKVEVIGSNAFAASESLKNVDLSSANEIHEYAFTLGGAINVILNKNGTDIGEGAFAYCHKLASVENLGASKKIASYAFADTNLSRVDLTSAEEIGDHVFKKENKEGKLKDFKLEIVIGDKLVSIGDNPFAFCEIVPFAKDSFFEFGGKPYPTKEYTFDISDTVKVINGSLYCKVNTGYELITYGGFEENGYVTVVDGTVRIGSYAFAGSDVETVVLPRTLKAIGHKAFFQCEKLKTVNFNSYNAPILEEQLDVDYYNSYDNIPGSGDYDLNGIIIKQGLGIVDYFMWNAPSGLYYDVYFGANFVNHIGHIDNGITMVKPENGIGYDTFIFGQYFDKTVEGESAKTDETLAAIDAIAKLPAKSKLKLSDEPLVIAAREAYNKIAQKEQRALVFDYSVLVEAEEKIARLKGDNGNDNPSDEPSDTPSDEPSDTPNDEPSDKPSDTPSDTPSDEQQEDSSVIFIVIIGVLAAFVVGGGAFATVYILKLKKKINGGASAKENSEALEVSEGSETEEASEETEATESDEND